MTADAFDAVLEGWREPGLVPGFELLNVLGSGGQGCVFKARKSAIGRTYAIKFLRPADSGHPTSLRAAELQHLDALAELRHPHLVSIEDCGEARGLPYLVLEYAGDQTLKTLLQQGRCGFDEALRLLGQAADAVQYLHRHGVLHLDVKPSNVYVLDGRAKLGDFGLVRLAARTGSIDLSLALGTPDYVAPEVVARNRASAASDVYGLGRTLDDLLIGAAIREDRRPAPHLLELVTEATALDPERRPALPAFRARLAAPRGLRPVHFRPVTTPRAGMARRLRFRRAR